jgi:uncharacterized protein YdaU (DUF1376 family)
MNYYEHHIGDYAEATLHLTFVEDAAYSRCIRKYYSTEKPLPADLKQVQRLVGARTREEKSAVASVLEEFFILVSDGWHNKRCDSDLAKFLDGEPEREVKKANEDNRMKRHRAERAALFQRLVLAGQHAPWNIGMTELRELVSRIPETVLSPLHATAPATPATATQTPDTRHQTPDTITQTPLQVQKQPQHQPLLDDLSVATPKAKKPRKPKAPAEPGTGKAWVAYANAYWQRYNVEPVRNAMVNGQLSQLVKRIGAADAEHVAAFYVGHRHRFYVEKMHPVGLLLADCEKLRTEWATSTQMTATRAQQVDRTQTNLDAFAPLIAAAREREQAEKEAANASK